MFSVCLFLFVSTSLFALFAIRFRHAPTHGRIFFFGDPNARPEFDTRRKRCLARPSWAEISDEELGGSWAASVWRQIREATWRVFYSAAHSEQPARVFRPVPCSFEMLGLDAMVDADGRVWLLEINCDPDLKVFDRRYAHIAKDIVKDAVDAAVCPSTTTAGASAPQQEAADVGGFHLVFEEHVPDRFLQSGPSSAPASC